jgi:WD40 repeat protein
MSLSQPESRPQREQSAEPQSGPPSHLPFGSLAKLLEAHRSLLAQLGDSDSLTEDGDIRTEDPSAPAQLPNALRQQIIAFIHRGTATGRALSSREDRTVAQSVVNFWVSWLDSTAPAEPESGRDRLDAPRRVKSVPFTQTVLQPFNQKDAEARGDALDALVSALDEEQQVVARRLLLRFVHLRADGDRFDAVPTVRTALQDIGPTEQVEAILQSLINAGLVRSTPADIPELDRLALAFPEVVDTSEEYIRASDKSSSDEKKPAGVRRKRLAFRDRANRWQANSHGAWSLWWMLPYLGAPVESEANLTEARLYHDKNKVERNFLFACLEQEQRRKENLRSLLIWLGAIAVISGGLSILAVSEKTQADHQRTRAETEAARAETEKALAKDSAARAEREKVLAELEKGRADRERARAESEWARAEKQKAQADSNALRANSRRDAVVAGSQLDLGDTIEAARFATFALLATPNEPPLSAQVTLQSALSSLPEQITRKKLPKGKRCTQVRVPPDPNSDSYSLLFDDLSVEVWGVPPQALSDVQVPMVFARVPPPAPGVEVGQPAPTLGDDGAHLLRRCGDTVELWSTRPAAMVRTYPVPKTARVVFAEGGTHFAYNTSDRNVIVCGLSQSQQSAPTVIASLDDVKEFSISPHGALVSVLTKRNALKIIRVSDKHAVNGLGLAYAVEPAHFGPDESIFAVATSGESFLAVLWQRVQQLFGIAEAADALEEGPDPDIRPHSLWHIDIARARARRVMAASLPSAPLFDPDGRVVAVEIPGSKYRTIQLYNAVSGALTSKFIIQPGSRLKSIGPAGAYAAVSVRNRVELWNTAVHEVASILPSGYSVQISGAQAGFFTPGPSYESSSWDTPMVFQDEETVLITGGGWLSEWNIASNAAVSRFSLNTDQIKDASVTREGDLVTADVDYSPPQRDGTRFKVATVRKWGLNSGDVGQFLNSKVVGTADRVRFAAIAPEAQYWLTVDGPFELSFRSFTSSQVVKKSTEKQRIISVAPGGATAVASVSDGLLIYRASDGEQIGKISIPPVPPDRTVDRTREPVFSVSDDGKVVAFGRSAGGVALRRIDESQIKDAGELEGKTIKAVTLNFDGSVVAATFDDGSVAVWDAEHRKVLCRFSPTWTFGDLVLSRTGRFLACASGNVSIWDVMQGKQVARLPGGHYWPPRLLFSWDEKQIAVYGGRGGQIGPWSLNDLLETARRELGSEKPSPKERRLSAVD